MGYINLPTAATVAGPDPESAPNTVLAPTTVSGIAPRWCGSAPDGSFQGTVQLRAHGAEHRATVRVDEAGVEIELHDAATGIAPGQSAVVYDGSRVVGSCTISATDRVARR